MAVFEHHIKLLNSSSHKGYTSVGFKTQFVSPSTNASLVSLNILHLLTIAKLLEVQ